MPHPGRPLRSSKSQDASSSETTNSRTEPGPAQDRIEQAQKPGHDRRMPAVILAAAAIGQLHHRVIGHLPGPVQQQQNAEAQKQKPLRQKEREFFPSG